MQPETLEKAARYDRLILFRKTEMLRALLSFRHKTIGLFAGNQSGKTSSVAYQYVLRMLGLHPLEEKNKLSRKIRCMSSTLPESDSPEEQDNTQYLELKKLIPPELILSDVTSRNKHLVCSSPVHGKTIFEFRSSKQELQDTGKIQLSSVWHDEETPKSHREESKMRLLAENGDEIFSLTPTNPLSYCYDDIFLRSEVLFRTTTICDKFDVKRVESFVKGSDVACIQMATDDNPTLDPLVIDRLFEDITDPDILAIRRYGFFKQSTGVIHKAYDPCCYIDFNKYFPEGIPYSWFHARGIDYHESRTPWSIGWLSASPDDEWFLWHEFHPAIDGPRAFNTYEIAREILSRSGDYYYAINLIDPLARKKQPNTGFSAVDDLNRHFSQIRQNTGLGTAAYWEPWDTKDTKGRGEVGKRFRNAVRCGVPFNNLVQEDGRLVRLPTLWICNTCPQFDKSIRSWRYGEHVSHSVKVTNDPKSVPQQRYSHDNMVLECLAKDLRLLRAAHIMANPARQMQKKRGASSFARLH